MRALFLLLAVLLAAGCSGDLRTHPVGRSTTPIPKLTAPPEEPMEAIEKELEAADFTQSTPDSLTWQKGTKNGGIIVTLSPENGVKAVVQYNRVDGNVRCRVEGPRTLLLHRIQSQDLVTKASQLVAEYGCTPA